MPLNESLNTILDVINGQGYIQGIYNQDNRQIKITYEDSGQEYDFNLSKHKWEDGSNLITLYEEIEEEEENYDIPVLMIMFDSVQGAEDFYWKISEHLTPSEGVPPSDGVPPPPEGVPPPGSARLKHKKKSKKRKSKKIKSKKIKSKKRKSKKRKSKRRKSKKK